MGQYSFTRVLASEEFSYGGIPFGRSHDPSELTGDHGIAGSLELNYTYPVGLSWFDRWQGYAYGNAGYIWRRHTDFRDICDFASDGLRWHERAIADVAGAVMEGTLSAASMGLKNAGGEAAEIANAIEEAIDTYNTWSDRAEKAKELVDLVKDKLRSGGWDMHTSVYESRTRRGTTTSYNSKARK